MMQRTVQIQQAKLAAKDAAYTAKRIVFLQGEIRQLNYQITMMRRRLYALERNVLQAPTTQAKDFLENQSDQSESQMQATLDDDEAKLGSDQSELSKLQPDTD
jgi:hypothetical protein